MRVCFSPSGPSEALASMIEAKDLPAPADLQPVRRALLSTYDKTGLPAFARRLHALGVELVSTGGTGRVLREAGLPVTDVADLTGFPEILGGRVKTLHPAVLGGLLARRNDPQDERQLEAHGLAPIDLVVCNLYPFEEVAAHEGVDVEEVTENIDIGGPTMVRAAAKNFFFTGAVTSPDEYEAVADELEAEGGALSLDTRRRLARRAFGHTARYDAAIAGYFEDEDSSDDGVGTRHAVSLPETLNLHLPKAQALRYGENPHQQAALYSLSRTEPAPDSIRGSGRHPERFFEKLHGKDLSFNNLMDLSAALFLIDEFRDDDPTCAILKHTNPCGVGTAGDLEAAYQRAFSTDRQSPFGGIVVVNRALDRATAEAADRIFTEIIIAPEFEEGVLDLLMQKKNRRLIRRLSDARTDAAPDLRSVLGGVLAQKRDPVLLPTQATPEHWNVVTRRAPTDRELRDLRFAWRVVKHVKSNAIVYARDRATLGIGAGQMSRIDASELAVRKGRKAELDFAGSVVASDAFFPFADGLEAAARAGARAAIQPGGSIRDDEVIEAADAHGVAMILTGRRHFRH